MDTAQPGLLGRYDKPLFFSTAALTLLIVLYGALDPEGLKASASAAQSYLSQQFWLGLYSRFNLLRGHWPVGGF